uniref:Uncharacterized protein n=1 Tax=Anguilla anguilla TaxID=7936 RepID=A0A0E9W222_ANGAN
MSHGTPGDQNLKPDAFWELQSFEPEMLQCNI